MFFENKKFKMWYSIEQRNLKMVKYIGIKECRAYAEGRCCSYCHSVFLPKRMENL